MSFFCVLENSSKSKIEIIKIGFSWRAFFFTFLWGFANKICPVSIVYLIISCLLWFVLDNRLFYFYIVASSFFWGGYGNDSYLNYYNQKLKFNIIKLISASNATNAFFIYKN